MTGADWIWDLCELAEGKWRIYWIGGEPTVANTAANQLTAHFPNLEIATNHGFHPKTGVANQLIISAINEFKPDIVLVGMGSPTQEEWVHHNRDKIDAPVVWTVGATADYLAGVQSRQGPRWLLDNHEWVARLWSDPRRLWRRYLLGNPAFIARVLLDRLKHK